MSECARCQSDAVLLATTGCIHEHITADVPLCQFCLDTFNANGPWCCLTCEWNLPEGDRHCCPQTLTTTPVVAERAS